MSRIFEGASGASETVSTIDSDVVNKIITDIVVDNAQLCDRNGSIIQKINTCKSANTVNIPNGIKQKAAIVLLAQCAQDAQASSKISNDIANAVSAAASAGSASGAGLLFNGAVSNSADITTKVNNEVKTTIKNITTQSCNVTTGVDQSVDICGSNINIGGIEQSAAIQISGGCDQISKQINDLSTSLSSSIQATASSGTNLMAGIVAIVFLFVIMAIIAAVIYNSGNDQQMRRYRRPMIPIIRIGRGESTKKTISHKAELPLTYDW